jgi:hypothetical protein
VLRSFNPLHKIIEAVLRGRSVLFPH